MTGTMTAFAVIAVTAAFLATCLWIGALVVAAMDGSIDGENDLREHDKYVGVHRWVYELARERALQTEIRRLRRAQEREQK